MKTARLLLAILFSVPASESFAAYQNYPVHTHRVYVDENGLSSRLQDEMLGFHVELVSDTEGLKTEENRNGRPFVIAHPGESYAVRLHNPLPVRVGVNLTIDGLNSIDGKPSGISNGQKWLIEPYSVITIRGWQVDGAEARRFFFTEKPKSYAKWRGKHLHTDLAANCGVIGAAYFWNQAELDRYYAARPIDSYSHQRSDCLNCDGITGAPEAGARSGGGVRAHAVQAPSVFQATKGKSFSAGTGMGEREANPVTTVEFQFDAGMYELAKAVVIYYDFARAIQPPNPFPETNYAPEM